MTLLRFVKPVLVAGFFVWAVGVKGQVPFIEPTEAPAAIVPYVQADTDVSVSVGEPVPLAAQNSRSMAIRVQQLEEEIRRLNGLVEEQSALLDRLQDQSLERYVEIDRRLAAVMSAPGADAIDGVMVNDEDDAVAGTGVVSTNVPVSVQVQPGEEQAYQAAYGLVRERRFEDALGAFNDFLSSHPFGRFAPNAHYWLGELYLVVEPIDPEAARQNFQALLDQYPNDRKIPDALYKLGRVQALKGNLERSQEYLNRVIRDYGDEGHPAAQLAQDFLESQQ